MAKSESTEKPANGNKKRKSKPKLNSVQNALCNLLELNPNYLAFCAEGANDKQRTLLSVSDDKVCSVVLADYIGARLADSVAKHDPFQGEADEKQIDHAACTRAVRRWAWITEKRLITEWPALVAFKSDDFVAFRRLDFDPEPITRDLATDCPIFAEVLSRMTNSEAFCHRVGALFDPEAVRKQAVWLYGPTDGGKSFIQDALAEVVGGHRAVADLGPDNLKGAFWKAPLVGKTLVLLREAPTSFIGTDAFKNLTGEAYHLINPKGAPQYMAKLTSLVFCSSNSAPEIPDDDAIKGRIIACRLGSIRADMKMPPAQIHRLAMSEMPKFLWYCINLYRESGTKMATNDKEGVKALEEGISEYEMPFMSFFDRYFKEARGEVPTLQGSEFDEFVRKYGDTQITPKRMRDFCRKRFNAEFGYQVKTSGANLRYVKNIARRVYTPNS